MANTSHARASILRPFNDPTGYHEKEQNQNMSGRFFLLYRAVLPIRHHPRTGAKLPKVGGMAVVLAAGALKTTYFLAVLVSFVPW